MGFFKLPKISIPHIPTPKLPISLPHIPIPVPPIIKQIAEKVVEHTPVVMVAKLIQNPPKIEEVMHPRVLVERIIPEIKSLPKIDIPIHVPTIVKDITSGVVKEVVKDTAIVAQVVKKEAKVVETVTEKALSKTIDVTKKVVEAPVVVVKKTVETTKQVVEKTVDVGKKIVDKAEGVANFFSGNHLALYGAMALGMLFMVNKTLGKVGL